jgi:co-chaperonin GroES (HSP10)
MEIKALNNYVTLDMIKPDEVKRGSFFVPQNQEKTPRWGRIVSVGDGFPDLHGTLQKPDVSVGQIAYVMAHGKYDISLDYFDIKEPISIASVLDILAVMIEQTETEIKIQPLGNYVEIEKLEKKVADTDLALPEDRLIPSNIGRVKTVGTGWKTADGHNVPFQVAEGDLITFNPLRTMVIDYWYLGLDKKTILVSHSDILGVIKEN